MFVWYACNKTHAICKRNSVLLLLFLLLFVLLRMISLLLATPTVVHGQSQGGEPVDLQTMLDQHHSDEPLRLSADTVYYGPITIDRPLQVIAEQGATLRSNGPTSAIIIKSPNVLVQGLMIIDEQSDLRIPTIAVEGENNRLSHLTLHTASSGIQLRNADYAELQHISIAPLQLAQGMNSTRYSDRGNGIDVRDSKGVTLQHNDVIYMHDGYYLERSPDATLRENNAGHSRYGYHIMFITDVKLLDNTGSSNVTGAMVMNASRIQVSGNRFEKQNENVHSQGILAFDVHESVFDNNDAEGNRVGFYIEESSNNKWSFNRVAHNYIGIQLTDAEHNAFQANHFVMNVQQAQAIDSEHNTMNGNFWDGFRGVDMNGDGYSELQYAIQPFFLRLINQKPEFQLFFHSPGMLFLESMLQGDRSTWLKDERPLMASQLDKTDDSIDHVRQKVLIWSSALLLMICMSVIYLMGVRRR